MIWGRQIIMKRALNHDNFQKLLRLLPALKTLTPLVDDTSSMK